MYWKVLLNTILQNRWFYFLYLVALIPAVTIQITYTQFEISLFINSWHNEVLDFIFNAITNLGDGVFAVAVIIAVYLFRRQHTLEGILCFAISSAVTQALKRLVFYDHLRPSVKMREFASLHYVPGVTMHELHSFPSGHSTSAFAVFLFLALIGSNKKLGAAFLALAVLVGLSRIYLLQHFFEDVLAGSLIGVITTTIIYSIFETRRAAHR
jgi:membrane-associated phospholipid phosphatase